MSTMNVTIRVDQDIKAQADELFSSFGLSFSAAVNLFVKKALRCRAIPFAINDETPLTPEQRLVCKEFAAFLASDATLQKIGAMNQNGPYSINSILSVDEIKHLVEQSGS